MQKLRYIDLFAGIGGFHQAFQPYGSLVQAVESDTFARRTFIANMASRAQTFMGIHDVRALTKFNTQPHDILCAGFPCQPFSKAGKVSRKLAGKGDGFEDTDQGTLIDEVIRILAYSAPFGFILENVEALLTHNKGETFNSILERLQSPDKKTQYTLSWKVIDAVHFVPQHRRRLFIVGMQHGYGMRNLGEFPDKNTTLKDILHNPLLNTIEEPYTLPPYGDINEKYTISDQAVHYMQEHKARHQDKGHGFGFRVYTENDVAGTLLARYYKDGSEILIAQDDKNPRKLTPRECARLMGFPDTFRIPVSDTQAYKQFGNAVVVPLVQELARYMSECFREHQTALEREKQNIAAQWAPITSSTTSTLTYNAPYYNYVPPEQQFTATPGGIILRNGHPMSEHDGRTVYAHMDYLMENGVDEDNIVETLLNDLNNNIITFEDDLQDVDPENDYIDDYYEDDNYNDDNEDDVNDERIPDEDEYIGDANPATLIDPPERRNQVLVDPIVDHTTRAHTEYVTLRSPYTRQYTNPRVIEDFARARDALNEFMTSSDRTTASILTTENLIHALEPAMQARNAEEEPNIEEPP